MLSFLCNTNITSKTGFKASWRMFQVFGLILIFIYSTLIVRTQERAWFFKYLQFEPLGIELL